MEENNTTKKRDRDEETIVDSPEVKRLRENLLEGFGDDDDDAESELCTSVHDLDSFMKSFQDEITASPSTSAVGDVATATESGESQPELGYLLEASDDELGLPPPPPPPPDAESGSELVRVGSDSSDFGGEFWEVPGYDEFGFGFDGGEGLGVGEVVALDGLFDYSDLGSGSGSTDFSWRPETKTLPAQ